jgi:phospholipid/cholesterol/gamma-HCH transport system substrate-binding protein
VTAPLTELLSDKNQNSISDILENIDATTKELRKHAPELGDTIREIKIASHNAGVAANSVAALADNTNRMVTDDGKPAVENLNKAITSIQQAADNLNGMISDARPGVQNFSKSTLPEANKLVHDLRDLSQSLRQVSDRVNQQGIGGTLGPKKLPDYKPGKRK